MHTTLLNDTLEKIDKLPKAQQEALLDIVKRRLLEQRRKEIAQNARETRKAFERGRARRGSIAQLKKELEQ